MSFVIQIYVNEAKEQHTIIGHDIVAISFVSNVIVSLLCISERKSIFQLFE